MVIRLSYEISRKCNRVVKYRLSPVQGNGRTIGLIRGMTWIPGGIGHEGGTGGLPGDSGSPHAGRRSLHCPGQPNQRRYEALRAWFAEGLT